MSQVLLVGEDGLCCALGERLIAYGLPEWTLAAAPIDKGGISKLVPDLPRYAKVARGGPAVLCIADSDQACPVTCIQQWMPQGASSRFVLRLAVREAESWLLADRNAMTTSFRIPRHRLPTQPDDCDDPKRELLSLLQRFAPAELRREMVTSVNGQVRMNSGYNARLREFVRTVWQPSAAADVSVSLHRALRQLDALSGAG